MRVRRIRAGSGPEQRIANEKPVPAVVAIGNFDGVHRGHRTVLAAAGDEAARRGIPAVALTFFPHPRRYFVPDAPPFRLQSWRARLASLAACGMEEALICRFDPALVALSAHDFVDDFLMRRLGAAHVVTGENFTFGAGRAGDAAALALWAREAGMGYTPVPSLRIGGAVCSSSRIREALKRGDMEEVAALLGQPYAFTGRVRRGDGRGRTLGFPTANLHWPPDLLPPAYGVYAVRTRHKEKEYAGVANFGLRPTFGDRARPVLEMHLFDFEGDLYGVRLSVEWRAMLRAERRFDGVAELERQIARDCEEARRYG